jgi:hypothetical protein
MGLHHLLLRLYLIRTLWFVLLQVLTLAMLECSMDGALYLIKYNAHYCYLRLLQGDDLSSAVACSVSLVVGEGINTYTSKVLLKHALESTVEDAIT